MKKKLTREELEKEGLILPQAELVKYSRGYASRIPMPKTVEEFKEIIAEAYFAGTELATDFYLEHR